MPESLLAPRSAARRSRPCRQVGPVHLLRESGEVLVHVPHLTVPAAVVRLATCLDPEEQLRVEVPPAEYTHHRDGLEAACKRRARRMDRMFGCDLGGSHG